MEPLDLVKNFRDVGLSVNAIAGKELFPEEVLYRGGRLNSVFEHEEILNIPTILNLRSGKDDEKFKCSYLHVPAKDKIENYDTSHGKIRKWVNKVISKIVEPELSLPIFIHCTSGKDRTGVITAVILKAFGVPDDVITKEYLLSDGVDGPKNIQHALLGVGNVEKYLESNLANLLVDKLSDKS